MTCPFCNHDDATHPLVRISATIVEWICDRCGLTWNVEGE